MIKNVFSVFSGFQLFSLVNIPPTACIGTGGENGTCYTGTECTSLGGTSVGTCFNNLGTCCACKY